MSFDVLSFGGGHSIRWGQFVPMYNFPNVCYKIRFGRLYDKRENEGQSTERSVVDNVCPEMNELVG